MAAICVVVFVSFSVPTVVAGAVVAVLGLRATSLGYGLVVSTLAAITTVAVSRHLRSIDRPDAAPKS